MADVEDEDELIELNDLVALQRELDALKKALGGSYKQVGESAEEEDGGDGEQPYELSGRASEDQDESPLLVPGEEIISAADSYLSAPPAVQDQGAVRQQDGEQEEVPRSVEAVRAALEANRRLQARLQRLLRSTDRAINRNADMLASVRSLDSKKAVAAAGAAGEKPAQAVVAPAAASWFWQVDGLPPPPPPDATALRPLLEHLPLSFRRMPWSDEERQRLQEGVLQMVQEIKLDEALGELQGVVERGGGVTMADYQARSEAVAALTLHSPGVQALADTLTPAQWGVVLQRMQLAPQHSAQEAQLYWRNAARPALAQGGFIPEEDGRLLELVGRLGTRQWEAVSRELSSGGCGGGEAAEGVGCGGRTPLACLARYQQLQQAKQGEARAELSDTDIQRLNNLVAQHGAQWKVIGPAFGGGYDGNQLMHIWRRHRQRAAGAEPGQLEAPAAPRKGKWTAEEDDLLLKAMAVHQRKWSKVATLVPGRSDVQCRERFMNVLNPEVRQNTPWSQDEEEALAQLVAEHTRENGKVRWAAVAAKLPGRTDKQCATQWQKFQAIEDRGTHRRKRATKKAGGRSGRQPGAQKQGKRTAAEAGPGARAGSTPRRTRRRSAASLAALSSGASTGSSSSSSSSSGGGQVEESSESKGEWEAEAAAVESSRRSGAAAEAAEPAGMDWEQGEATSSQGGGPPAEAEAEAARGRRAARPKRQRQQVALSLSPRPPVRQQARQRGGRTRQQAQLLQGRGAAGKEQGKSSSAAPGVRGGVSVAWGLPQPTHNIMPCSALDAVGQEVQVWWASGSAGRLLAGTITACHLSTGQHTVVYLHGPEQHSLAEETLVWKGGAVTGPGAAWPEEAPAEVAAAALEGEGTLLQQQQQPPLPSRATRQGQQPPAAMLLSSVAGSEGGAGQPALDSREGLQPSPASTAQQAESARPQAAEQPSGGSRPQRAKRGSSNLEPPQPTQSRIPCSRTGAVGQKVQVWWILNETTGRGRLYPGIVTAFDPAVGQHTVEYKQGPEQHTLAEESLVWEGGAVTGPGAPWPEDLAGTAPGQPTGAGPTPAPQQAEGEEQQAQQQALQPLAGRERPDTVPAGAAVQQGHAVSS